MRRITVIVAILTTIMYSGCSAVRMGKSRDKGKLAQTQERILIRGGAVIDGSGGPAKRADVLIEGDRIAAVGTIDEKSASGARTIDATGKVVTPGFIDAHSHGNPLETPDFKNFIAMGVTTICLGQDGDSPNREDLSGYMREVDEKKPGPNIALFVGQGTVRDLAGVGMGTEVSPEQMQKMADLVEGAMAAGCFGMTTGLEYEPGRFGKLDELIALAKPVGRHGGMVMSHMRSEDDDAIEGAIDELLAQGRGGGCPVHISHMKIVYGHGKARAEQILAKLQAARDAGQTVTADQYPYMASYTGIGIVFPDWAKGTNKYETVKATRRDELKAFLHERVMARNGPEATLFGTGKWKGKTLAQVAKEAGKPFEDVLIDDIGPRGASGAYFVMDQEVMERFFMDPHVMVSSDGSPTGYHPRGHGTFAKIIREFVMEKELVSLEEAVRKMTGLPAQTLDLDNQKRGLIAPGYAADVLVFDPAMVRDTATFNDPYQLAEGFDWVVVNGTIERANGEFTGDRGGKMLRHTE